MSTQEKQGNKQTPNHKSISLTGGEYRKLKRFVAKYPSQTVAAQEIGLSNRDTLARVLKFKSGAQSTIDVIRERLSQVA